MSWEEERREKERAEAEYLNWLRGLQPGQRVARENRSGWAQHSKFEFFDIERLTPTIIIAKSEFGREVRICRKNGWQKGEGSRFRRIQEVTPEVFLKNEEYELRHWLEYLDTRALMRRLDIDGLRELKATVDKVSGVMGPLENG